MKKKVNKIMVVGIVLLLFGMALARNVLNENIAQNIYTGGILLLGAWILVKALEKPGMPQLFMFALAPVLLVLNKMLCLLKRHLLKQQSSFITM